MSDIPQELIDQLKDLVRKEVRAELQKKEPPRGKCDADAQRFWYRGWG